MLLKVSDKNSNIASVHIGEINNITKIYNVIKFVSSSFDWLFSRPKFIKKENRIEWHTDLVGEAISYTNADINLQSEIVKILKTAVNSIILGKTIEQIDVIKTALEIPSFDDIFYISGKVVLTQWGHIGNSYNSKRGLIFELIGDTIHKLNISVFENGRPAIKEKLELSWSNYRVKTLTNIDGEIDIFVPVNEEIEIKFKGESKKIYISNAVKYLEINFTSEQEQELRQELTHQKPLKEELKPFILEVKDCENDLPIVGKGKIIIEVDDSSETFDLKESKVLINKWFGKKVKIESSVEGYIIKNRVEMLIESGKVETLCLYPMVIIDNGEGKIGDPRFNISWKPSPQDIDIMVITPCGEMIYFDNTVVECNGFRGELDIDIREIECSNREDDCQENITFDNGGSRGEYKVIVRKFEGTNSPTDIVLTIINNGETIKHNFILKDRKSEKIFKIIH